MKLKDERGFLRDCVNGSTRLWRCRMRASCSLTRHAVFQYIHAYQANRTLSPLQIKPLTEEEKKQKLAELKERMAAKKAAKAKEEAKESVANEAIRRKAGRVRQMRPKERHPSVPVAETLTLFVGHECDSGGDETEGAHQGGREEATRCASPSRHLAPETNQHAHAQRNSRTRRPARQ